MAHDITPIAIDGFGDGGFSGLSPKPSPWVSLRSNREALLEMTAKASRICLCRFGPQYGSGGHLD
jgi:hypothetical protein